MLQGANTDPFNPLVSKADNSECQIYCTLYSVLTNKVSKSLLKLIGGFLFFAPSTSMT